MQWGFITNCCSCFERSAGLRERQRDVDVAGLFGFPQNSPLVKWPLLEQLLYTLCNPFSQ